MLTPHFQVPFAKEFEFRAESISLEAAEREICKTLRLKDCQAWFVNDNNLCRKRPLVPTDSTDLAGYLRYDAINKVITKLMEDINVNQGRQAYTGNRPTPEIFLYFSFYPAGKGADETDKFLAQLAGLKQKFTVPKFWIMLEKEFKDDKDKLVSSVCKYDSSNGNLNYCGTICLQMNDEAVLKPTTEFFNMILYNSDPNSKVYLRRFLNPANVTKVSPQDDIEGINNFDIFVIQVRELIVLQFLQPISVISNSGGGKDQRRGDCGLRQVHHTEDQRVPGDIEVRPLQQYP